MSTIFSIWTVVVLILFIGIVAWAWSNKRKPEFDEAARIPFSEEDNDKVNQQESENPHA